MNEKSRWDWGTVGAVGAGAFFLVCYVALWGCIFYVALHFIAKWW